MHMNFQHFRILFLLIFSSIIVFGCSDNNADESQETVPLLPYDAANHIYGSFGIWGQDRWEVVIDPSTGQLDKITETSELFGGFSGSLGTQELTSFERNERIFIPTANDSVLILQNLESFESTTIELTDLSKGKTVIFPQIIRFGKDQNEIYLLDTDKSLWKINLENKEVTIVHIGIPAANQNTIVNFFYIESTGNFLCILNGNSENDEIVIFNPEAPNSTMFEATTSISTGFGFVQHPIDKNKIYYVQQPDDSIGFRLMRIQVDEDKISVSQLSSTDLKIDNLSYYLQTIHSTNNTYILRGGSTSFDSPSNTLYSVNLNTGILVNEIELKEVGHILKLAGE